MGRKKRNRNNNVKIIAGSTPDGKKILTGEIILKMRDEKGLSMSDINGLLDYMGMGFDVVGFVKACFANPNFSKDRCLRLLKEDSDPELHPRFEEIVNSVYGDKDV